MWTEEKSLELIELYKHRPTLWDPKDPTYFRKQSKAEAWQEIGDVLTADPDECKSKMISLLASYRREKGRIRKSQTDSKARNNPRKKLLINKPPEEDHTEDEASGGEDLDISHYVPSPNRVKPKRLKLDVPEPLKILETLTGHNVRNSFIDEENMHFANFVCSKLQKYTTNTKNYAQRAITKILFKADQGHYDCKNNDSSELPSYNGYAPDITENFNVKLSPLFQNNSGNSSPSSEPA